MNYRVHKAGTIHTLAGCCKQGKNIKEENFFEVMTIGEAQERLKAKGIVPFQCSHCDWSKDEGGKQK